MSAGDFTGNLQVLEKGPKARIYVSKLGRFAQADPIIQSMFMPSSLNRYSYVMNNPVIYLDPSGNIVVCFQGGANSRASNDALRNFCADLASQFNTTFVLYANWSPSIDDALDDIKKSEGSGAPVIIVGFSWGADAAIKLSHGLKAENIAVDGLVLIDPILNLRHELQPWTGGQRIFENYETVCVLTGGNFNPVYMCTEVVDGKVVIPDNVANTLILKAEESNSWGRDSIVPIEGGNPIDQATIPGTDHTTILYGEDGKYNVATLDYIKAYLSENLRLPV